MADDPYRYFRVEGWELHEQLGRATLTLERNEGGGADLVGQLLRLAHTLKGAARVVKQRQIGDHAHAIEEILSPHRAGQAPIPRDVIDALLALVDRIGERLSALDPQPVPGPAADKAPGEEARMVRAKVAEVDTVLEGLAETQAELGALRRTAGTLEQARRLGDLLIDQLAPHPDRDRSASDPQRVARIHLIAEELRADLAALERTLASGLARMDRELEEVRAAAEQLRLVPAGTLFTQLERLCRDTATTLGRSVAFEGRGGEIRLDAHVLGTIQAALLQIVRNAVAHGIEAEPERRALGKPPTGRVMLEILRRGRQLVFRCRDDGRGVDLEAVRRSAANRGLAPEIAAAADSDALVALLLRGGISTAGAVTDVSGRGVGLDVVRESIRRLGGEVHLATQRGQGTTFELVVPLSLAAIDGLLVDAAGAAVTLPLDSVRRSLRIAAEEISRSPAGDSLLLEGTAVPFVQLAEVLAANPAALARRRPAHSVVVLEAGGQLTAVGVDGLLGTSSVVLRPLPELAPASPVVAGVSLDGEGKPRLALDPDGITRAARHPGVRRPQAEPVRRPVLVVDDSLTTRMLEQSILESAGFEVDVATSGEEALETARKKRYALCLVDVEMPGMDGFTFIERMRADPQLRDTPAILVSSRSATQDRERGAKVGAQGYIVKSEFDQAELIARIETLVG